MLQVFATCTNMIRTFPALVYSDTDVEDVDTRQEDHLYDQLRYVCMKRRITPKPSAHENPPKADPLNQWRDQHAEFKPKFYGY